MFAISKSLRKTGGIAAIIAGILGILAAQLTLLMGSFSGTIESEGAHTILGLGLGAVLFSFLTIVFGAVSVDAESKIPGILVIITAVLAAVLGGMLVAVFMTLALLGGILALFDGNKAELVPIIQEA